MTTYLLIRHASHDFLGRTLVGRGGNVPLNQSGCEEAIRLAERLAPCQISALYCSPQLRARETAQWLLQNRRLNAWVDSAFDEIDFGAWTGREFQALAEAPAWARWNHTRSSARCPGGERMRDVQRRAVHGQERLRRNHPDTAVAVVSHGDVIKAMLLHWMGMSLDLIHTLEISPASVSVLTLEADRSHLRLLNDNGHAVAQVFSEFLPRRAIPDLPTTVAGTGFGPDQGQPR